MREKKQKAASAVQGVIWAAWVDMLRRYLFADVCSFPAQTAYLDAAATAKHTARPSAVAGQTAPLNSPPVHIPTSREMQNRVEQVLRQVFGFQSLRPHQVEPIKLLTETYIPDMFCIFPTSAGKSLLYQFAAVYWNKAVVVVSPLLSLMQEQIQKLRQLGLNALTYSSDNETNTKQDAVTLINTNPSSIQYLFVTPESLQQTQFQFLLRKLKPCLVAVDEAHVITEWGKGFRRSYRCLDKIKETLPTTPILALTASTTYAGAQDIIQQLRLVSPRVFVQSFNRPNIHYSVWHRFGGRSDKITVLMQIIQTYQQQHPDRSVIVYVSTRQEAENLEQFLGTNDVAGCCYHAGLAPEQRSTILQDWVADRSKLVIATIAFAMGIDKGTVGLVIHYCLPKGLESFYQESGRAGRDGQKSYSVVLVDQQDVNFRTTNVAHQPVDEQLSYYWLLRLLFAQKCRRRCLLEYFNAGVPDMHDPKFCCDACGTKSPFSEIFGLQENDFSSTLRGVEAQLRHLAPRVERLPLAGMQLGGAPTQQAAVSHNQERPQEEPGDVSAEEIRKKFIKLYKKKTAGHTNAQLDAEAETRLGALATTIMQKSKGDTQKAAGAQKAVENYIQRAKGAFTFRQLETEVFKFFLTK